MGAALIAIACARAAGAAELTLSNAPYDYTVIDQDIHVALREFGANLGTRVTVSDAVAGRIRGRLPPLSPKAFLDRVAALYGLDWYYDGYAIGVTAQSEGQSKVIATPGVSFPALKAGLDALGVTDDRFVLRPQKTATDLVLVAGPPRYVQLVEETAGLLTGEGKPGNPAPATSLAPDAGPPAPGGAARPPVLVIFRQSQSQRQTFDVPDRGGQ